MTTPNAETSPDVVIDLNFVPSWARTPPAQSPYRGFEEGGEGRREGRDRDRDRGRDERRPGGGFGGARRGPPRERDGRRDDRGRDRRPDARAPAAEEGPRFPHIEIEFLPERGGLGPLARRVGLSARAYSLFDIACFLLSNAEYYAVRLTAVPDAGTDGASLHQCTECKLLFPDRRRAEEHALDRHFDRFYRREEKDAEPPKGNFRCVARCPLSGELLGPPNYHGYDDRVKELHRTRFAHMSLDEYRRRIENVHDPEVVEQWKQKMSRQTVYQTIGEGEVRTFARLGEVEAHYREHHAASMVHSGRSFVVPGTVTQSFDDPYLRRMVKFAWERENHHPLRLSIQLRLALRHLGLHLLKIGEGGTFVTSVRPAAIDPATAVPVIREVLQFMETNPGCTAAQLIEGFRPGTAPDAPEAAEVKKQLRWLIDRGHVIEFSDGRMAVPVTAVKKLQLAKGPDYRRRHAQE